VSAWNRPRRSASPRWRRLRPDQPAAYPSTGHDREARISGDHSASPNIHALLEDHRINADNLPIKIVNFNGVGTPKRVRGGMMALHPTDPIPTGIPNGRCGA